MLGPMSLAGRGRDGASGHRGPPVTIYTRRGDDGTTGLRGGERVAKNEPTIELLGTIDEAQAVLGMARVECDGFPELSGLIECLERDLWVLMADVGTASGRDGAGGLDQKMVARLEAEIDRFTARTEISPEFAVPGENRLSATLDVARTVVRRAERIAVGVVPDSSTALAYLNRLSDLCWMLARSVETEHRTTHREPGHTSSKVPASRPDNRPAGG